MATRPTRRERVPGGRSEVVGVRLTREELEVVTDRAAAAGLTEASYLAVLGLARDQQAPAGSAGSAAANLEWRNAAAAELLALVRQVRGIANNLNQVTYYSHQDRRLHPKVEAAVEDVSGFLDRALAVAALLDPRRPDDVVSDGVAGVVEDGLREVSEADVELVDEDVEGPGPGA
jgi:hypothetical protein